jgi:hypothetical protein
VAAPVASTSNPSATGKTIAMRGHIPAWQSAGLVPRPGTAGGMGQGHGHSVQCQSCQ